jgi:protein-L-isoaspartate(D-aspartate) O-methyltransferase
MKRTPKPIPLPEGVEDHGPFQRRFWFAQRCAWLAFALILLACLFGLLGRGGMFSRAVVHLTRGTIDLPAISRWNAPDDLKVTLIAAAQDQIIFFDPQFLESFSVEGIDPPQKATVARGGRIGYVFSADPAGPTSVVFRLQTQQPGWHAFAVGIGDDVSERSTFIFP